MSRHIEKQFINYFQDHGYLQLPESSLISKDKNLLYTIAGMLQFKPYFKGDIQPPFEKIITSQRCIRTNDIEEVGKTNRHLTGFTMLGHFQFGGYDKQEILNLGFNLITEIYGINKNNLIITVHPDDIETKNIWLQYIPNERIILTEENIWSSGNPGLSGYCTEFYYDFQPDKGLDNINLDSNRFLEFYNIVFINQETNEKGEITKLDSPGIDSGIGLERLTYILGNLNNVYETDGVDLGLGSPVLNDHYRTYQWLINEGVKPSNTKHGYILRKLMRRMFREGFIPRKGENEIFINEFNRYQEIIKLGKEKLQGIENPSEEFLMHLYQTYGIPIELYNEIKNN